MEMKPKGTSLGRNPLSDAPHRNPGVVSNGQGPGRHPLGGAPYLDTAHHQGDGGLALAHLTPHPGSDMARR